ncbi:hypothetical protein AB834_04175 [PVC group bacterium (ex Bugula neritina AB1)]|nr:hypothetical protein AB834_04175 [PVC group bacterium (ex Bugula neritina AB1)]
MFYTRILTALILFVSFFEIGNAKKSNDTLATSSNLSFQTKLDPVTNKLDPVTNKLDPVTLGYLKDVEVASKVFLQTLREQHDKYPNFSLCGSSMSPFIPAVSQEKSSSQNVSFDPESGIYVTDSVDNPCLELAAIVSVKESIVSRDIIEQITQIILLNPGCTDEFIMEEAKKNVGLDSDLINQSTVKKIRESVNEYLTSFDKEFINDFLELKSGMGDIIDKLIENRFLNYINLIISDFFIEKMKINSLINKNSEFIDEGLISQIVGILKDFNEVDKDLDDKKREEIIQKIRQNLSIKPKITRKDIIDQISQSVASKFKIDKEDIITQVNESLRRNVDFHNKLIFSVHDESSRLKSLSSPVRVVKSSLSVHHLEGSTWSISCFISVQKGFSKKIFYDFSQLTRDMDKFTHKNQELNKAQDISRTPVNASLKPKQGSDDDEKIDSEEIDTKDIDSKDIDSLLDDSHDPNTSNYVEMEDPFEKVKIFKNSLVENSLIEASFDNYPSSFEARFKVYANRDNDKLLDMLETLNMKVKIFSIHKPSAFPRDKDVLTIQLSFMSENPVSDSDKNSFSVKDTNLFDYIRFLSIGRQISEIGSSLKGNSKMSENPVSDSDENSFSLKNLNLFNYIRRTETLSRLKGSSKPQVDILKPQVDILKPQVALNGINGRIGVVFFRKAFKESLQEKGSSLDIVALTHAKIESSQEFGSFFSKIITDPVHGLVDESLCGEVIACEKPVDIESSRYSKKDLIEKFGLSFEQQEYPHLFIIKSPNGKEIPVYILVNKDFTEFKVYKKSYMNVQLKKGSYYKCFMQTQICERKDDPADIQWPSGIKNLTVVETTGKFCSKKQAMRHFGDGSDSNVWAVVLSAPGKGDGWETITHVNGVNPKAIFNALTQENEKLLLSAASCTTNAAAPILEVLSKKGPVRGVGSTYHTKTNSQKTVNAQSVISTTSGAQKALAKVLDPEKVTIDVKAMRFSMVKASLLNIRAIFSGEITSVDIVKAFREEAQDQFKDLIIIDSSDQPTTDSVSNKGAVVLYEKSVKVIGVYEDPITGEKKTVLQILCGYGNEDQYVNQLSEAVIKLFSTNRDRQQVANELAYVADGLDKNPPSSQLKDKFGQIKTSS